MIQPCSADNCERPQQHRDWCGMHYQRFLKYGDANFVQRVQVSRGTHGSCVTEGCELKPHGRGLCDKHYKLWQRKQSPEYSVWLDIKRRCYNPNFKQYQDYGGRGIQVCDEWKNDFTRFLTDMSKRPSSNHSIERRDVNGNYEPSNCYWTTFDVQSNNKRNNVLLAYNGKSQTISQWAKELGMTRNVIRWRYYRNWDTERIFKQGVRRSGTIN